MRKTNMIIQVLFLMLVCGKCTSQVSDLQKPSFHSLNSIGLLNGTFTNALQLQTIEGMEYKNWFAGLGVGIDYYRYRTIPLFFDLRHFFGKTQNKFFVYGDAGNSFAWLTKKEKNPYSATDKFKGEGYFDLGGGYQLAVGKRHALLISAGYSQLKLKELVQLYYFLPNAYQNQQSPWGGLPQPPDRINYTLSRLTIKLGLSL